MIEYGNRARDLPAPPNVVCLDLVEPRSEGARPWLRLLADELAPRVIELESPTWVVWSSLWATRPDDQIVFELSPTDGGSSLRVRLLAGGDPPGDSKAGHIRKRINRLLVTDLRFTYGQ